jgi:hypothetical protein
MSFYGYGASLYQKVSAKTANYQMAETDIGVIFTNRGASGAVTFTLPNTSGLNTGWWCEVFAVADQDVTVASYGSSDNIVTFNDAAADSVALATVGEKIGGGFRFVWDGTGWLCFLAVQENQTVTIA